MIAQHAAMARRSPSSSSCPTAVLEALGAAYETVGRRGWPGELQGEADPDRRADRAARRVRRGRAPHRRRRRGARARAAGAAGKQFDPGSARRLLRADADGDPVDGLDAVSDLGRGDRRRAGAGVVLVGRAFDAALLAIANFVDLKSPYTLGHSRAVAELAGGGGSDARPARGRWSHAAARRSRPRPRPARRLERDLGQAAGRSAPASGSACACTRTSPSACSTSRRRSRRSAQIAVQHRERSTAPATRAASPAARSPSTPGSSAPPTPTRRCASHARTGRRVDADDAARELRAEVRAGRLDGDARRGGARPPPAIACRAAARGRPASPPREVEVLRLLARGLVEQGDRRASS